MASIEVSSLTKKFGDVIAVQDVSFVVEDGEVFGFLGPNGAGKSTTINMLLGYMRPTGGTASILGYDVESESREIRKRMGVLPENIGVYDRLTGREHVESAIRLKGVDDDPDRILSRVGLDPAAHDRQAGEYSTGMAQRLALATALAGDPDILVLDEPQSGLDPNGMADVRDIVLAEADRGTTVFFSSHIIPEVEAVSDRVGIMRAGEIVALNTVDALLDRLGGETVVTAEPVEPLPSQPGLDSIDGVTGVKRTEESVKITCGTSRAKARALALLERSVGVADFEVEEGNLEDSFAALTNNAGAGEQGRAQDGIGAEEVSP